MREALEFAFANEARDGYVSQVVFITDGNVGNEDELFSLIKEKLGARRLFTIGIGSAPNQHFMSLAAEYGRGTYTNIGAVEEVADKMTSLFGKLEQGVLHEISVEAEGGQIVEIFPQQIPDLYLGEPLSLVFVLGSYQNNSLSTAAFQEQIGGLPSN